MIVAHVGAVGGGAGAAALKIYHGTRRAGVDAVYFTFAADGASSDGEFRPLPRYRIASPSSPRGLLFRAAIKAYHTGRAPGAGLFSYTSLPFRSRFPFDVVRPDIIHLNWIAQGIDYRSFFGSIPPSQPVAWSLLDMEPFTGGCHYSSGCERYAHRCGSCPQLNGLRNPMDLSAITFARKKHAYAHLNLTVVAVSRAHRDQARRAPLFADVPEIPIIPVGVDTTAFTPVPRKAARAQLALEANSFVVSFAAVDLMNVTKGFPTLLSALAQMRQIGGVQLLLAGGPLPDTVRLPVPVLHTGYQQDPRKLAVIYSAADVHVMPSLSEALGQVGLEAMACGTPVVGSRTGGIPDYVIDGVTGRLFDVSDAAGLAGCLDSLRQGNDVRCRMGEAARALVERQFSVDGVTRAYLDLYERIVSGGTRRGARRV